MKETEVVRRIITLARNLREKEKIKIRQPLSKIYIAFTTDYSDIINKFKKTIMEEINVKDINIIDDVSKLATITYLPNYKTLGPIYTNNIKEITNLINNEKFIFKDNKYYLDNNEVLKIDDIIVRYNSINNEVVANDSEIVLKLDTNITKDLKEEGLAREIVRNIQDARKTLNCNINDRIKINISITLRKDLLDYILNETLSTIDSLERCDVELNVDGVIVKVKK